MLVWCPFKLRYLNFLITMFQINSNTSSILMFKLFANKSIIAWTSWSTNSFVEFLAMSSVVSSMRSSSSASSSTNVFWWDTGMSCINKFQMYNFKTNCFSNEYCVIYYHYVGNFLHIAIFFYGKLVKQDAW